MFLGHPWCQGSPCLGWGSVELGGFDSEPEAVCVLAKALKKQQQYGIRMLQRLIVVHLRIGSGFNGVLLSRFCTFCH